MLSLIFVSALASSAWAATANYTVSWQTEPNNVENYTIEKSTDGGETYSQVAVIPAPVLEYTDTGNPILFGTVVCFRVTPHNSLPSSGASSSACHAGVRQVGDMPTLMIERIMIP